MNTTTNSTIGRQYWQMCFSQEKYLKLLIPYHTTDLIIQHYIFPVLFLLGFVGNGLNLIVLLARKMRTKTNVILACMALADTSLLTVLCFRCLSMVRFVVTNTGYYEFYSKTHNLFTSMANWCSAASIWFVVTVTIERLLAIKFPLTAQFYLTKKRLICVICLIITVSLLLSVYHTIAYKVLTFPLCNGTQTIYTSISITQHQGSSKTLEAFVRISTLLGTLFVVAGPLIILFTLNLLLILALKRHRKRCGHNESQRTNRERALAIEKRVCFMVVITVTSFIICNMPSAVVFLWHYKENFSYMSSGFYDLAAVSNALVVVGKVLNFVIYCTSSSQFRSELIGWFKRGQTTIYTRTGTIIISRGGYQRVVTCNSMMSLKQQANGVNSEKLNPTTVSLDKLNLGREEAGGWDRGGLIRADRPSSSKSVVDMVELKEVVLSEKFLKKHKSSNEISMIAHLTVD